MKTASLAALLAACGAVSAAAFSAGNAGATKAPTLETIKALEGKWVAVDEDGRPTDEVLSDVRVTAGGSAVLEILFPGTEHEMVTVYHQDGDDLMLTHYCVLGNQPRMKAERGAGANQIVFKCVGGTNMKESDAHMHQGTITFLGEDRLSGEWLQYTDGERTYTAAFELARRE